MRLLSVSGWSLRSEICAERVQLVRLLRWHKVGATKRKLIAGPRGSSFGTPEKSAYHRLAAVCSWDKRFRLTWSGWCRCLSGQTVTGCCLMDSKCDDCYGEVKEEKYVSRTGSFSRDCRRNARQQQMVLVVQPWRELGFSALDDDLPLTTVLTCVSTGQRADWPDWWQGLTRGLGPPVFVTGLTRILPKPQPGGLPST